MRSINMDFSLFVRSDNTFKGMLELAEFADQGNDPYLEAWTAMAGIGVRTKNVRIGQIVLFNSLRNPAYLAKSISTLDNMIDGRYECMIGAGWNKVEYESYDLMEKGRGMPSAKERVDRLEESLIILRGMFDNPTFSYEGNFWTIKEAKNIPQPQQKHMKISVGASKPRMLKITAKYADGLNISSGVESYEDKIKEISPELEKYNKNFKDFNFSGFHSVHIADTEKNYEELVVDIAKSSIKDRDWVKKNVIVGTPEILIEKLRRLKDAGLRMTIITPREGSKQLSKIQVLNKVQMFTDEVKSKI